MKKLLKGNKEMLKCFNNAGKHYADKYTKTKRQIDLSERFHKRKTNMDEIKELKQLGGVIHRKELHKGAQIYKIKKIAGKFSETFANLTGQIEEIIDLQKENTIKNCCTPYIPYDWIDGDIEQPFDNDNYRTLMAHYGKCNEWVKEKRVMKSGLSEEDFELVIFPLYISLFLAPTIIITRDLDSVVALRYLHKKADNLKTMLKHANLVIYTEFHSIGRRLYKCRELVHLKEGKLEQYL